MHICLSFSLSVSLKLLLVHISLWPLANVLSIGRVSEMLLCAKGSQGYRFDAPSDSKWGYFLSIYLPGTL